MQGAKARVLRSVACGCVLVLGVSNALAQGASVTGTITTSAKGTAAVRVTFDQKVCGDDEAIVVDAQGRLANAVVTLVGLRRAAAAEVVVTNGNCRFAPRVQIVRPNGTIKATSTDPMLHTTQAQRANGSTLFNVALPMPGITIPRPAGGPGILRVNCNIHQWMRAWLIVTDEAAAVSGADGRFTIASVPPGTYEARVWHESLKGASQKITVAAGKPTAVAFQLK
jgi:plastocyanin